MRRRCLVWRRCSQSLRIGTRDCAQVSLRKTPLIKCWRKQGSDVARLKKAWGRRRQSMRSRGLRFRYCNWLWNKVYGSLGYHSRTSKTWCRRDRKWAIKPPRTTDTCTWSSRSSFSTSSGNRSRPWQKITRWRSKRTKTWSTTSKIAAKMSKTLSKHIFQSNWRTERSSKKSCSRISKTSRPTKKPCNFKSTRSKAPSTRKMHK